MCRLLLITVTALTLVYPALAETGYPYVGEVTGQDIYVRSGPDRTWYEVTQLSAGTKVTVVGAEGEWLKILPPEGTFSLVNKQHVKRDGDIGTITGDQVLARAGSLLRPNKVERVQGQFNKGSVVQIIGETDEYYKIKPVGAVLYVHNSYVHRVGEGATADTASPASRPAGDSSALDTHTTAVAQPRTATTRSGGSVSGSEKTLVPVAAPKPANSAAKAAYDAALKDLNEEYKKPSRSATTTR